MDTQNVPNTRRNQNLRFFPRRRQAFWEAGRFSNLVPAGREATRGGREDFPFRRRREVEVKAMWQMGRKLISKVEKGRGETFSATGLPDGQGAMFLPAY